MHYMTFHYIASHYLALLYIICIHPYIHTSIHPSPTRPPGHPPTQPAMHTSIHPYIHPSIHPSIHYYTFFFFSAIGLLGETRRHGGSFLIKRLYSVLCHFLQGTSHFSVLDIKWVSVTQVPSYLHSFMCPGEPWSSYSSFVHCSWYQ